MDLEIFIQTVLTLLKDSKNFYFLLYAVASSVLTQIVKKLFVNKVKVEIFGKFNGVSGGIRCVRVRGVRQGRNA